MCAHIAKILYYLGHMTYQPSLEALPYGKRFKSNVVSYGKDEQVLVGERLYTEAKRSAYQAVTCEYVGTKYWLTTEEACQETVQIDDCA